MTEYRTPEEDDLTHALEARVRAVLDDAATNLASLLVAMELGESDDVVEQWIDTFWEHLRGSLSDDEPDRGPLRMEERLTAIALLLHDRASGEALRMIRSVRSAS